MRNGWDKITLDMYQQVDAINHTADLDVLDKSFHTVCIVFNISPAVLNEMKYKKVERMIVRAGKMFSAVVNEVAPEKIGIHKIEYNIENLTYGQFVELSSYLQKPPLINAHKILATAASPDAEKHKHREDYFLNHSVRDVPASLALIVTNFVAFLNRWKNLFGLSEGQAAVQEDPFNKRYGWFYSASAIAELERIPYQDVFSMNVVHAFNDLAYLKARNQYDLEQSKKK